VHRPGLRLVPRPGPRPRPGPGLGHRLGPRYGPRYGHKPGHRSAPRSGPRCVPRSVPKPVSWLLLWHVPRHGPRHGPGCAPRSKHGPLEHCTILYITLKCCACQCNILHGLQCTMRSAGFHGFRAYVGGRCAELDSFIIFIKKINGYGRPPIRLEFPTVFLPNTTGFDSSGIPRAAQRPNFTSEHFYSKTMVFVN